jgi:hypothetical protein
VTTLERIEMTTTQPVPYRLPPLAAFVLALLAFAGCGRQAAALPHPAATPPPTDPAVVGLPATAVSGTILAYDQSGDGTSLRVSKVDIEGMPGWIIIHSDDHGPGEVIGHAAIPEGVSTDVVVPFDKPVPTGTYWLMVHRDGGDVGTFQWPGGPDGPVRPPSGSLSYASNKIVLNIQ